MDNADLKDIEKLIITLGQKKKFEELQQLVSRTTSDLLIKLMSDKIGRSDATSLWNFLLQGFTCSEESREKRFSIVMAVLNQINKIELNTKQTFDIITRLNIDLPTFVTKELVVLVEFCTDSIQIGDPKCVGWKDLLPPIILLINNFSSLTVNGIRMSGTEYRSLIINNLCVLKWPDSILTPLTSMFKEIMLTKEERTNIVHKICENLHRIQPTEIPALLYQLFALCTTTTLVLAPILTLQKYFNKYYYKKLYEDMDSNTTDLDSIEIHSDKELREVEETIFYHLSNCTEYRISEKDIVTAFRVLAASPHYLLTPFIVSAILTLSKYNRYPETTRLSSSPILPFLRNVIKNNEHEKEMAKESDWCRQTLNRNYVDLSKLFAVLIDQSKDGMDVVTPGIVGLSFVMLKAKYQPQLNYLGISFLQNFLKKRFIFGQGIIKTLAEFLFADQEASQYAECLTTLSLTNTLTVSECVGTIKNILDFFLMIPGNHAMRMILFIYPLIRLSFPLRDALIDMLRKAMYGNERATRKMGVFGFCMLLKQLKNNNSRRTAAGANCTQNTISGFSLMSQATLGARDYPQRHFDMLTLEILGILRKCFNEMTEIKEILYESLTRAIEFNPKLTPHILQFMDWHFRSYFEVDELNFEIKFDMVICDRNDDIEVWDQLGKLIYFMGYCIIICEKYEVVHDNEILKKLLESLIDKIDVVTLDQMGIMGTFNAKMNEIGSQYISCLEALMAYAIWITTTQKDYIPKIIKLFKHHNKMHDDIKAMNNAKKGIKKGKKPNNTLNETDKNASTQNSTSGTQSMAQRPVIFKPENIWDIATLERFLRINYEDNVTFATPEQASSLRTNRDFSRYLLRITKIHIEEYRSQPDYRHIKNSKRMLSFLCQCTRIIFEKCVKRLPELIANFDTITSQLSLECFKQCLLSADFVYKRKLDDFFQFLTNKNQSIGENVYEIITVLHLLIEQSLDETSIIEDDVDGRKLQNNLLQCLEILYDYIPAAQIEATNVYNWLYKFCVDNSIENKNLELIHKLLFRQRIKLHSGVFFNSIAMQISKEFGIIEEIEMTPKFVLKTISSSTVESCLNYLSNVLKTEIENVEYMITKVRSINAKIKIIGNGASEEHVTSMKTMERSICSHLVHIGTTLIYLTNTHIPLGACMDGVLKVLIQFYVCIANITKYLIVRHGTLKVSYQIVNFDQLVKTAGKPLANRVYDLITYIEENILPEDVKKKKNNAQAEKSKVLKETKFLPKLVLWIENFNKYVTMLCSKTKVDLTNYLHMGTVRDFRIKTSELREAIDLTIAENAIDEDDPLDDNDQTDDNDDDDQASQETVMSDKNEDQPISGSSDSNTLNDAKNTPTVDLLLTNLAKVNHKSRRQKEKLQPEKTKEPPKAKRIKPAMKINKRALKLPEASTSSGGNTTNATKDSLKSLAKSSTSAEISEKLHVPELSSPPLAKRLRRSKN